MSHDLYILKTGGFKVRSMKLERTMFFPTIEQAAEALEGVGVLPDEMDTAIVEMYKNKHNHVNFGAMNGTFIFSDVVDSPEHID